MLSCYCRHFAKCPDPFACLVMPGGCRALTPLFGNGAGAHGIGKISGVLTKIGNGAGPMELGKSVAF